MTNAIDIGLNAAVTSIARKVWRLGYDISDDAKYASAPDPETYYNEITKRQRVTIYTGGSEHTIFGEAEINYDFRAWHEWTHYILRAPFTLAGELAVARRQCEDIARLFGNSEQVERWQRLIMAEVYGQALYFKRHGQFPSNQIAFDRAYVNNPELALTYCR